MGLRVQDVARSSKLRSPQRISFSLARVAAVYSRALSVMWLACAGSIRMHTGHWLWASRRVPWQGTRAYHAQRYTPFWTAGRSTNEAPGTLCSANAPTTASGQPKESDRDGEARQGASCGNVDESFGPERALRAVWTARGQRLRVAHRLPTLSLLSPTVPQDQQQIVKCKEGIHVPTPEYSRSVPHDTKGIANRPTQGEL